MAGESITLSDSKERRVEAYSGLVGYAFLQVREGSLLAFGAPDGANLVIGIPNGVSATAIRAYLAGKLPELSADELPEPPGLRLTARSSGP